MKKNKPNKKDILYTPCKTIADLKFDWVISTEAHKDINEVQKKILKKNPHLIGLNIIPDNYSFLINNSEFKFTKSDVALCFDKVLSLFEYICFYMNMSYSITGTFSHFERIDDQTYRIHMKKKS